MKAYVISYFEVLLEGHCFCYYVENSRQSLEAQLLVRFDSYSVVMETLYDVLAKITK
jgi:hypothetical protein